MVVEWGLTVYDAYQTYKTLIDPNVGLSEKGIQTSLFCLGILGPGGGYGAGFKWLKKVDSLPWLMWGQYDKVVYNGREYARIGDRLYSQHAVERMMPRGLGGRSVAPAFVEDVIRYGDASTEVEADGVVRTIYRSGTVKVVTEEEGRIVITVNPYAYRGEDLLAP